MDSKDTAITEHTLLRATDGESIAWISGEQYLNIKTLHLLTPKFTWKDTIPVNLNKFHLGPSTLAGNIHMMVDLPGISTKPLMLSVNVTRRMLEKPEVTMVEVKLRGF